MAFLLQPHYKTMKRFFSISIFCLFLGFAGWAAQPDWAFPKKVASNQEKLLRQALRQNDNPAALQALICLTTAECLQNRDNAPQAIERLKEVAEQHSQNTLLAAMTRLLTAEALTLIYDSDTRLYQQRQQPGPADNPLQWNARQLCDSVMALISTAMADSVALSVAPIGTYGQALEIPEGSQTYFPSLYSFACLRAYEMMRKFDALPGMKVRAEDFARSQAGNSTQTAGGRVYWALQCTPAKDYRQLLEQNASTEYSGDILLRWPMPSIEDIRGRQELYRLIEGAIKAYPTYYNIEALRQRQELLTQPRATLIYPSVVCPSSEFKLVINTYNAPSVQVQVYRLPSTLQSLGSVRTEDVKAKGTLIATLPLTVASETIKGPWSKVDTLALTLDKPGRYALLTTLPGVKCDNSSYTDVVQCTDVAAVVIGDSGQQWVQAFHPVTGAPSAGAQVLYKGRAYDNGRHTPQTIDMGFTDTDGHLLLSLPSERLYDSRLEVSNGQSTYGMGFWPSAKTNYNGWRASGYTSLPLYRPGDKVQWTFVVSQRGAQAADISLAKRETVKAQLYDANYQEIDSYEGVTDDFGRISGEFDLPIGLLQGSFTIRLVQGESNYIGTASFMVSDYKMPTIKVEDVAVNSRIVTAKAVTYTGLPVGDAQAQVIVSTRSPWRWWWRPFVPQEVWKGQGTSSPDGHISIEIPEESLSLAGTSWFTVRIGVTATNGETQWATSSFTIGRPLAIRLQDAVVDTSHPYSLPIEVVDGAGNNVDTLAMKYILLHNGKIKMQGEAAAPFTTLDLGTLTAGEYELKVAPADSALADTVSCQLTLYYPSVAQLPVNQPLWLPSKKVTTAQGFNISVPYGVADDDTYVFYWLKTEGRIAQNGVLTCAKGFHNLNLQFTQKQRRATLTFLCVRDLKQVIQEVEITCDTASQLRLTAECMRDILTPGNPETWRLRVSPSAGASAMMLDLYNQAIEALVPVNVPSLPWQGWVSSLYSPISLSSSWARQYDQWLSDKLNLSPTRSIPDPSWQLYGKALGLQRSMGYGHTLLMKQAAAGSVTNSSMVRDASPDMLSQESPEVEQTPAATEYRPIETPLAFYRPMLTTEADGGLTLTFTTPQANATWVLQALAWTADLRHASLSRTFTATRPLMIQTNAPRLLRTGDQASVAASILNSTSDTLKVQVISEAFNPLTFATLRCDTTFITVAPRATVATTLLVEAPYDLLSIGLRVKAGNGIFTDGESTIIPVLASAVPVVESRPIYMAPDQREEIISLQRPAKSATQARMMLQFTTSPQWYVVTAMPSLRTESPVTATQAADNIFTAAIGRALINQNPSVGEAITLWSQADARDSTLVSMLQRNTQFKTALLQATPWMQDAANDTERLSRLYLLLSPENTEQCQVQGRELLASLAHDGGLSWCAGARQPSQWATMRVLDLMGRLRQMNIMPRDVELNDLCSQAINWLDNAIAATWRRFPKTDFTSWAVIRSRFDHPLSPVCRQIMASAVSYALKHWREADIATQAQWAIMLKQQGYEATASEIVASLTEYTSSDPVKGTWLPRLDGTYNAIGATAQVLQAVKAVNPSSPLIQGLTQWLVLQKGATSWPDASSTAQVIAALAFDGNLRLTPASDVTVMRGSEMLNTSDSIERITGHFTVPIQVPTAGSVPLTIARQGREASYGVLYTLYKAEADEIPSQSTPELSIERTISPSGDTIAIGDLLRVTLTINAQRDMDYVVITSPRAAGLEPVEQLPGYEHQQGLALYRNVTDQGTQYYIDRLPKGHYQLTYELTVNAAGRYSIPPSTIQSQYAPQLTAHTSGTRILCNPN